MDEPRVDPDRTPADESAGVSNFELDRRRLRTPEIDTEPSRSPLDALARGLVTLGDRLFKGRAMLRIP